MLGNVTLQKRNAPPFYQTMPRQYHYVGPERIRERVRDHPPGAPVPSAAALTAWMRAEGASALIVTYTVGTDRLLRVADRHSEHVACAGLRPVLAAGEMTVEVWAGAPEVVEVSNLSTGYCPEPACWAAVAESLDRAGIPHPGVLTAEYEFRRCERCGQRNVVKDEWLFCSCGAALPETWNFA